MALFSFIPGLTRCCCCTRSLKMAALFIIFLSMIAGCYAASMCLHPSCKDMFSPNRKGIVDTLNIIKWIFFTLTVILLISCFTLFLAIYLQELPHRSIPADAYVVISVVWSVMAFLFAVVEAIHYTKGELKCKNPSDFIAAFLFIPCMLYFTCIINSYIQQADDMK